MGLLRCLPTRGRRKSDGPLQTIAGALPALGSITKGCVFAPRCPLAEEACRAADPPFMEVTAGHYSRCIHYDKVVPAAMSASMAQRSDPGIFPTHNGPPILAVENLSKTFGAKKHALPVLRHIGLQLAAGETLGLVGESGSGKTTLARLLLGLSEPDEGGRIELDGRPLQPLLGQRSREAVKSVQIIFQNPDSALNRSHTIRRIIGRAIRKLAGVSGTTGSDKLLELTRAVRLSERQLTVRPRQLSGGLKQRVAIARAFAGDPRIVVCDEPTSSLDVSVQAAILNLLVELQINRQVSYIFISHDLGVVRYLADRIAVLYLGRLMEIGPAEQVFAGPHHPYTEALLSAIPTIGERNPERIRLSGEIPSAVNPPSGCVFHTRCPRKLGAICEQQEPAVNEAGRGHGIRCHIPVADLARMQSAAPEEVAV